VNRSQLAGDKAVQALLACLAVPHQSDLPEHPQVFGRPRLGHLQLLGQLGHRPLTRPEQYQDLPALRLGDRVEDVGRRRCSCHVRHHIPISACVKPEESEVRVRRSVACRRLRPLAGMNDCATPDEFSDIRIGTDSESCSYASLPTPTPTIPYGDLRAVVEAPLRKLSVHRLRVPHFLQK
jgi:hypothetical protein